MQARFAMTALITLVWLLPTQAQDKPSWEPLRNSGFGAVPLCLVPIGDLKKEKRPDAKEVWSKLLEDMGKDAKTQNLLQRLLNCTAVEIAILPQKVTGEFRPAAPAGKSRVYIGIRLTEGTAGEDAFKGSIVGSATDLAFEVRPTRTWNDKATVWDAFVVAANEYLYRTKKGYHLYHGLLRDPEDLDLINEGIRDPVRRGKYLASEIKAFLDKYKD